jgi:two-component system, cell cycle response regulator DivK
VDDHADGREMCVESLGLSGLRTAEAADGFQAIAEAQRLTPDCILMDLSLPGVDGWEATRRLKSDPRTRHIPIIAVTGLSGATEGARLAGAGFDAVVTKPCAPEDLVAVIHRVLRRPR